MQSVCDKDCFNCIYTDCIRLEGQDESDRIREYRRLHPERVKTTRRKQYIKNQDKEKEYQKKRYQEVKNTEEFKTSRMIYMRDYRAKKKMEVVKLWN